MFLFFAFVLVLVFVILWAAGGVPLSPEFEDKIFKFPFAEKKAVSETGEAYKIKMLTWNISYGHGMGSAGDMTYEPISLIELQKHLDTMISVIRSKEIDILFLQEVDFKAKRSRYLNELTYLAQALEMPYCARAWCWDANYVPFPYWPFRKHFGRVFSGGVVMSRFKISQNRVLHHKKPSSKPFWYNLFYLFRYTQAVKIHLNAKHSMTVLNNHLEAFDAKNRDEQVHSFLKFLKRVQKENSPSPLSFFAGDFNANAFETENQTLALLRTLADFQDSFSLEQYQPEHLSKNASFPSDAPSSKLDYIYIHKGIKTHHGEVLKTGECSDHFPVYAEVSIPIKYLESQA